MVRAVFVRSDGIILHTRDDDMHGGQDPQFYAGALDALRRLAAAGLHIAVIGGAAERGQVTGIAYRRVVHAVKGGGGQITHVRRPASLRRGVTAWPESLAQLLSSAAHEWEIDLSGSYLVSDTASDVGVARALDCRACYLVLTGRGRMQLARCRLRGERYFHVAFDLSAAAEMIVQREHAMAAEMAGVQLQETVAR